MPATNARIAQAQLLTDFIHIFFYSVRAVHDRVQFPPQTEWWAADNPHWGQLWQGQLAESSSDPRVALHSTVHPTIKNHCSAHSEHSPGWFLSDQSHCFTSHFPIMSSMMENLCCFVKISSLPLPSGSFSEGCPLIKNDPEMAQRNCRNLSEQAGLQPSLSRAASRRYFGTTIQC